MNEQAPDAGLLASDPADRSPTADDLTNRKLLNWLFDTGRINVRRCALFDTPPPSLPVALDWDRVEGMMLGLAVGDALGIPTEGQLPAERRARHGEIRDYLPNKHVPEPRGFPSDDTQLAFWTLEQLLVDDGLVPDHLAARFCRDHIFGIGSTVRDFIQNYKERRLPWYEAGPKSAGNGALMRVAPIIIPHLRTSSADLWVDAALAAMVTHNDSGSLAACLAVVSMLWRVLAMGSPPPAEWWLETYVAIARELEADETYRPRAPRFASYRGPMWRFVYEQVSVAADEDLSVLDACNRWHSGAFLLETVPSVLYILMRHGDNFEEAIVRAVNDTKDNDTVAAIVGAALGALHGKQAIPGRWLTGLSGRTTNRDDGRIFELLNDARGRWWNAERGS